MRATRGPPRGAPGNWPTAGLCAIVQRRVDGVPHWGPPQVDNPMPHTFPATEHPHKLWGGPPVRGRRPRRPARGLQGADIEVPDAGRGRPARTRGSAPHGRRPSALTAGNCSFATGRSLTLAVLSGTATVSERPGNGTKSHGRRPSCARACGAGAQIPAPCDPSSSANTRRLRAMTSTLSPTLRLSSRNRSRPISASSDFPVSSRRSSSRTTGPAAPT